MAFFWFNPFSGEKLSSQFVHYLQASNYVGDITSAITTSAAAGAVEQRRAIEHASSQVVGSLRHGFDRLGKLNAELKSVMDWRLSVVADQQRVGNLLTRNVALLLRIPDSEKERENLVREGFRFYQNASIDADLYTDALDYLLRAEALKKQDYFVLHRIGMIYLHAPDAKVRDFPKAEDYFFKPLNEHVAVYQQPFRVIQDLAIDASPQAAAALKDRTSLTINATLEYQACADTVCFNPQSVPLSWTMALRPLDRERVKQ